MQFPLLSVSGRPIEKPGSAGGSEPRTAPTKLPFACRERQPERGDATSYHSIAGSGGALPAVCRRWRRVFQTSSVLHGTLNLDLRRLEGQMRGPEDAAALRRLLELRGQAARRLWLHSAGSQLCMADVLRLLSPQLQAVSLGCCCHCWWLLLGANHVADEEHVRSATAHAAFAQPRPPTCRFTWAKAPPPTA